MKQTLQLIIILLFLSSSIRITAQNDLGLQAIILDSVLTKDANAIVRSEDVVVHINATNSITVSKKRVITVLNKYGNRYTDSYEWYDPSKKIKNIQATVYNALGKEIKKYKKKDFKDRSMYDGFSLIGDNRMLYFEHTPTQYPYTLIYECVTENKSTAWVTPWYPISGNYLSVEKSTYKVVNPKKIALRYNEKQFKNYDIKIERNDQQVSYTMAMIPAREPEQKSPVFDKLVPNAWVALQDFSLVDVKGSAIDWQSMGKWQYDNLVARRDQLAPETIQKITALVQDATTDREKAKRIYEYVQNKTRYISVQLGIGGWMPMQAKDVDELGYGDCKALTNYTKALLDTQDIESYYTVVYGDTDKKDIDSEFASMQGNHVILNIPDGEKDIWLECTSQTAPFDFIGSFTDDRNVLILKPEGGEIKRTKKYTPEENTVTTKATIHLQSDRSFSASITSESKGLQYYSRYLTSLKPKKDQILHYKEYWDYVNNLNVLSINVNDDKDTISYQENIRVNATSYATKAGSRLLLIPNFFNRYTNKMPKYEDRKTDLVIPRGYVHTDEYTINIPQGYTLNSVPQKKELETIFGNYTCELEKVSESQLKFKRFLKIKDGTYPKEQYEEYRRFMSKIRIIDVSKIVLKQQ